MIGILYSISFVVRFGLTFIETYNGWSELEAEDSVLKSLTTLDKAKTFFWLFLSMWFVLPTFWFTKHSRMGER